MLGGKNKQAQQKPNAVQMLQQLMAQHQALYQMDTQIINELKKLKTDSTVPDYSDRLDAIINEVRNLQGLVKGVNVDTKTTNDSISKVLQLLEKDIKPNIDSITGHIAGMQSDFEENLNTLTDLINQMAQTPDQLGEALNTVLENFQADLNEILKEGITERIDSINSNVLSLQDKIGMLQESLEALKTDVKASIEEPVSRISEAVDELQTLKESMPTEIGDKIEQIISVKLNEFDQRISSMENEVHKMKKMLEAIYKLFYGK